MDPAVPSPLPAHHQWLPTGAFAYRRMHEAIAAAAVSVRFEYYIVADDATGRGFRDALAAAAGRGVRVQVLVDGFGSASLPAGFWEAVTAAGGEARTFNPLAWRRFALRNHRKLLLIDDAIAFVGGFNIADEYNGDGVTAGWRDLGMEVHAAAALRPLAVSFDGLFAAAATERRLFRRMRHTLRPRGVRRRGPVLLSGPRLGRNPFRSNLLQHLKRARHVRIVVGYFVPSFGLRRALRRVARRGGTVELLLAGRSDVPLAQLAARARYGSLLRAGVQIREYQPQILHAKLAIVDGTVFVGSSNLDARSFGINYELMVRVDEPAIAAAGRSLFAADLPHSRAITLAEWRASQDWLTRLRGMWAGFLLTKVDPWLAHAQLRGLA